MTASSSAPVSQLCSELSSQHGLPLVGSAGCYDAILVFELDPPWTARLSGSRAGGPALDHALARLAGEAPGVRVLAVEPRGRESKARVLHFVRPEGPFTAFRRREYDVDREALPGLLAALGTGSRAGAEEVPSRGDVRDILVCTHGARDACCGKFGYPVYQRFAALAAAAGGGAGDAPLRVWRSSHLGGHRFAPTLLDLPRGRMFGRVTADDVPKILGGGASLVERLATVYRGRSVLPEAAQIVERQLWLRHGEVVEGAALRWEVEEDGDAWRVRLEAEGPGLSRGLSMEARVVRADPEAVTTPASCGRDPEVEAPWKIL